MAEALNSEGFLERNIEINRRSVNPSYSFRYSGKQVQKLFHYLYNSVAETQYLKRKYDLFKSSVDINS